MRRNTVDRHFRTEVRDQAGRLAVEGRSDDTVRIQRNRCGNGRITHCLGNTAAHLVFCLHEMGVVIQMLLRGLGDLRHHLHGFQRIFTHGGLTGKHNRVGAVVDGVCHVSGLRSRRSRVADHGIQHLSRRDDGFEMLVALGNDPFLNVGNLVSRDLYSEVASGHHNAVGLLQDRIDVFHTFRILDLGNDLHVLAAVLF